LAVYIIITTNILHPFHKIILRLTVRYWRHSGKAPSIPHIYNPDKSNECWWAASFQYILDRRL